MSLYWNDSLAVGHPLIDGQHREIFTRFHAFMEGCDQKRGAAELRELFTFLESYTASHFAAEEALMERLAYPHLADHRTQHRKFIATFAELQQELAKSGPTVLVLVRTSKTMVYWLTEHIRNTDHQLAAFLRDAPAT